MCYVCPALLVAKIKTYVSLFHRNKRIRVIYLALALPLQVHHTHVHDGPQVGERLHHSHI